MKNIELENSVLGGLVVESSDLILKLNSEDFTDYKNRKIFEVLKKSYDNNEAEDVVTLSLKLNFKGAPEHLTRCVNTCPSVAALETHINQLKKISLTRQVHDKLNHCKELIDKGLTGQELLNSVIQNLSEINSGSGEESKDITTVCVDIIEDLERGREQEDTKLFTGKDKFDTATAGYHKGEYTILAARPSVGKTAFIMQEVKQLAEKGNHIIFFSIEMTKEALIKRFLANIASVDGNKLRRPKYLRREEMERIVEASQRLSELPIDINDKASNIQEIRAYCRKKKREGKLDVIIIDYLQIVRFDSRTRIYEGITQVSKDLNNLKKEFNVPVIVLSQLSRPANGDESKEPGLSDLRDSGQIEQDADNVFFLHVPNPEEREDIEKKSYTIHLVIRKQRNGPAFVKIPMLYHKKYLRFEEV